MLDLETVSQQVIKRELLRIMSPENTRRMMRRRWAYVVELREAGNSWETIVEILDRSISTVQQLFRYGIKERQSWYTPYMRLKMGEGAPACVRCKFYNVDRTDFRRHRPHCSLGSFVTEPTAGCRKFDAK